MLKIIDQRYAAFDAVRKEQERQAAEIEHEQEIEAELKQIESAANDAKRKGASPGKKGSTRKGRSNELPVLCRI